MFRFLVCTVYPYLVDITVLEIILVILGLRLLDITTWFHIFVVF